MAIAFDGDAARSFGIGSGVYAAVEDGADGRDVVGVNQPVAVDVAVTDVFKVAVSGTQPGVVHIGGQVVFIDAVVFVYVSLQDTCRTGHFKDV